MAVFFDRCKPQNVDAAPIVLETKRVFIGYPMHIAGALYDPHNLKQCVTNPAVPQAEWDAHFAASKGSAQNSMNRNLVAEVKEGDIFLVPRPDRGVAYCGRVVINKAYSDTAFQFVNNPPWYDQYMALRGDADGDETWHAGDICQCWELDDVIAIPLPLIPAWIRRSLLGRSTYGRIYADEALGDPHAILEGLLNGDVVAQRPWTLNEEEIQRRLLQDIGPSTFEHLVVALMQFEYPDQIWAQIGGSGDGGVDGIGSTLDGRVTSLLQCKWQYWGGNPFATGVAWKDGAVPFTKVLASLRHPAAVSLDTVTFLGGADVAALVARHHRHLPWAIAMRVGTSTDSSTADQ